jgi:uncharacterized surface protein with fasciclin (FAS1) repeats
MNRRKFLETYSMWSASFLFAPNVLRAQIDIEAQTVVAIIAEDRDLDFLYSLLVKANMIDRLSEGDQVTVFAPNNAAFENLGEPLLSDLTDPTHQQRLTRILSHHVVSRRLQPSDLAAGRTFETINGSKLTLTQKETLRVGDAELIAPAIEASNGYIHKINMVLMPTQAA